MSATLTLEDRGLVLKCRYHAQLINEIKALPVADRAFDPVNKSWLIAPLHGAQVVRLLRDYLGEEVALPAGRMAVLRETRTLEVKYVGTSKDRASGERSAFGWCEDGWTVIFPEVELRRWFGAPARELAQDQTLYQILAVAPSTDLQGLKTAHRRLVRQWHPDVCQEPNATAVFRSIQAAYELLSDPSKRARYDAGLQLAASTLNVLRRSMGAGAASPDDYRTPLRCGRVRATGFYQLGRFIVESILAWDDIVNERGETLTVSWRAGDRTFTEVWV